MKGRLQSAVLGRALPPSGSSFVLLSEYLDWDRRMRYVRMARALRYSREKHQRERANGRRANQNTCVSTRVHGLNNEGNQNKLNQTRQDEDIIQIKQDEGEF